MEEGEYCARPETASTWPEQGEAVNAEEDVVDQDVRQGSVIQEIMPNYKFRCGIKFFHSDF